MVKFLIIRFSSIGDIVLTSPVIRCLKKQVPDVEIHFLTKKAFEPVLKNNPYIDKLWLLDNNLKELLQELKSYYPLYIIDLHRNLRSERIKRILKLPSFSFNKINFEKWLMVNFKKNRLPDTHIVDRYLQTLDVFDVKNDSAGLDYFINEEIDKPGDDIMAKVSGPYIAMAIGAQHFTKKAPSEKLAEICDLIQAPIIILGGKTDEKAAGDIIRLSRKNNITDLTGAVSLNNSAWLIRESKLVISHDTGMMHVAAAYKKDILSIWGNTIPEFGMYPYMAGKNSKIFEVKELPCRPCTKLGFRDCPKKHFKCMKNQDAESIAEHANLVFNK